MIIVDASTGPQRTDDKTNLNARVESSGPSQTPPPPPPYNPQTSYQSTGYYPVTDAVVVYRQSPAKRFWRAFGLAVLIWFLFAVFTKSVNLAFHHSRPRWANPPGAPPRLDLRDGTVHQCFNWSPSNSSLNHFPRSAEVFLELPVDSDAIYLFTRGSQSGHVDIVQSTTPTDKVGVRVRVNYFTPQVLDYINVCRVEREANENGVGILTPMHFPGGLQEIRFEVNIVLPAGEHGDPLHIKSFETETSNYSQDIADIWSTVSFDRLSLKTTNGRVTAKSITVEDGVIHSSNGAIKGHFNSGSSIKLTTSNGAIEASVSLLNQENGKPSELKMKTSNGKIDAKVDLITQSGQDGIFDVETHTSNGAVILEYTDMPVNAVLTSETISSNAAATVKLHGAFEGSFEVSTSNAAATLKELPTEDPSGQGRRRVVTQNREKNRSRGFVYWSDSRQPKGRAVVGTSNGRVELVI